MPSVRAYIGIGSNLHDPAHQVRRALQGLATLPVSRLTVCSPWYRTAPVGGPSGQPDYLNAVAALETTLTPDALLAALQALENAQGRIRAERWGPRTLDLDLLLYGSITRNDPRLTLPHPRLHQRAFVLYPLYDIAPDLTIIGQGKLTMLLRNCPSQSIVRLDIANEPVTITPPKPLPMKPYLNPPS
ncbi:MAG: 2-amino-4-hydroxy-6-hydroxymethyldihydropteridine diphosphokinase, partial [Candidatus Competibacteraceae bacterium]|nr:2-amino-4-hydroxy-6-hydroxymethyldihydropteridine diphosphokinase [Candidatus Competibacteraceae bacterium]MCB1920404.1 2-amino-4-hydroxy-6-hydroxymethyldihydropteridine diphosphokinase [Candidatus Competibacteraceae bacterium]MCP5127216.1 2-amino-4-hydroxy-6-hydroxymethyldihydropteridine diphosphokinase [Gammaproteobacteria bacterium]HRX71078.1 2-amino-4-hydroxy-6-hydroxymethyldihydropteridine diphosphokinase [Candidatus Competibacteraceae bacterium]